MNKIETRENALNWAFQYITLNGSSGHSDNELIEHLREEMPKWDDRIDLDTLVEVIESDVFYKATHNFIRWKENDFFNDLNVNDFIQ